MCHREMPLLILISTLITTLNSKYDYPLFTDMEIEPQEEKQLVQDLGAGVWRQVQSPCSDCNSHLGKRVGNGWSSCFRFPKQTAGL